MTDDNWFAEFNRLYGQLLDHTVKGLEKMARSVMAGLPLGPVAGGFMGKLGQVGMQPSMPLGDCYRILGLEATASWPEVERRYRELARRLHPDVAGAGTAYLFQVVTLAYHEIRKRKEEAGDETGATGHPGAHRPV